MNRVTHIRVYELRRLRRWRVWPAGFVTAPATFHACACLAPLRVLASHGLQSFPDCLPVRIFCTQSLSWGTLGLTPLCLSSLGCILESQQGPAPRALLGLSPGVRLQNLAVCPLPFLVTLCSVRLQQWYMCPTHPLWGPLSIHWASH